MKDIHSLIKLATSLAPAARTASANGADVDRQGFESVELLLLTGVVTDGTHTITLEESDVGGGSGYTAVAAGDYIGGTTSLVLTTAAGDDNTVGRLGYAGTKRYVRAVVVASGTTTGGIYGAAILLGNPRHAPVAEQAVNV